MDQVGMSHVKPAPILLTLRTHALPPRSRHDICPGWQHMAHIALVYLHRAHGLKGSAKVALWSEMALPVISRAASRWLNNRAENSHQPFRRREGAKAKFRDVKTLQKFAVVHASIHNHLIQDRHLNRRGIFKQNRSAAPAEWRQLAA